MLMPETTDSGQRPRAVSGAARATGFTLVELLLAVTVLGILSAMALPSLTDLVRGQRIKSASSDVYASLIYARSEAIKRADNVNIVPNAGGWATGWKVKDAAGTTDLKVQDAIPSVTVNGPAATVTFRRDGRIAGTATVEFVLSSPDNTAITARCVTLSLSGRPNIRADSNGNAADGCQ